MLNTSIIKPFQCTSSHQKMNDLLKAREFKTQVVQNVKPLVVKSPDDGGTFADNISTFYTSTPGFDRM